MKITAYSTPLIKKNQDLFKIIAEAIPSLPEKSIVVVASKIVATCEGRFVSKQPDLDDVARRAEKHDLVRQEAQIFTDPHSSKYDLMLAVKGNWMFVNAGIDESNADDQYLLWPENPQESANQIWQFLREHYGVKEVGVTISDSTSIPLNWGVIGHAIAHSGFEPLKSYIGSPDLYGRLMKMEQVNVMQAATAAAVLEMGEGAERTPLAIVEGIRDVVFQDRVPSQKELEDLHIELEDDTFAPILTKADWKKGGGGNSK
jgi:dihydrofolate synthase / folylpolyglutamate synthase